MAAFSGPSIVENGLVVCMDPANLIKHGATYKNLIGPGTGTNQNFTETNNIWLSNADPVTGAGTSELSFSGFEINTGSFTVLVWLKLTSEPSVGANNNWRSVFLVTGTSQSPFGILLEQSRAVQMSLVTTVRSYRHLGGSFAQQTLTIGNWTCIGFAYDHVTATGYAYSNSSLVRSGLMSTAVDQLTAAAPGEQCLSVTSGTTYSLSNNNNTSNPSGTGCFPGEFGPCLIYDRALSASDILKNYKATRGRYGI